MTKIKRKRGRPTNAEVLARFVGANPTKEIPVKRKRGRPRKIDAVNFSKNFELGETTYLGNLRKGTRFEFVGLEDSYRNLSVHFSGEGSVTITGDIRVMDFDGKKPAVTWKPLGQNYCVSTESKVRPYDEKS
jgi:hypothetical protein